MKTVHLDCQAGISGDMTVAALLDLGVPLAHLEAELAKLSIPLELYELSTAPTKRHGIAALKFSVCVQEQHSHRHYSDVVELLAASRLSERVKGLSGKIFARLAEAEAKVHGVPVAAVHFHEVGAVDSIVDIVGTAICLEYLNVEKISASSLPLCSGFVQCEHGLLPLPAPATAELLKGLPVHGASFAGERVTPTGAAIVAALATSFGAAPAMTIEKIGYGAGEKDFPELPNILRVFSGTVAPDDKSSQMVVIEVNIDDSTPEVLAYAMERLLTAGASDVWFTPIQMKKCRPAVMLSLITAPDDVDRFADIIFRETTAIGLRSYPVARLTLARKIEARDTPFGKINFKVTSSGAKPEFEDCRRIAIEKEIPLREVYRRLQAGAPDK